MNHNQASILDHEEVARTLGTDLNFGLSSQDAGERLKKFGYNKLDNQADQASVPRRLYRGLIDYLSQLANPLFLLLIICAMITAFIGDYENSISITLAILLVTTISYILERRADRSLDKLNRQMPNICKALRDGAPLELEAQLLVPGDVIYLNEGQRVPADVRLFELQSLSINEANLTGETEAQSKSLLAQSKSLADQTATDQMYQNLALMGTMVEFGHAKGLVICTGKDTRYGEVFCLLQSTHQPRSPLLLNIDQLSIHLAIISCFSIALICMMGVVQQRPAIEVAYFAVSLAVTAIPEGLPVAVAVIMALGVVRLSREKTIVKSLNSIETFGCIQILCADKTGTLTRDDMTLTDVVTSELHSLNGHELEEIRNEECRRQMTFSKFGGKMYSIGRLMEAGTLCNNASLDSATTAGQPDRYVGQATECAILEASHKMGFGDSRAKFERIAEVPFSSVSRRMAVQCKRLDLPAGSAGGPMYYVKGAWEEILADCQFYYESGLIRPRSDDMWAEYGRVATALGFSGLRVLALATGPSLEQLTFVGLVGISNALRDGIEDTLTKMRQELGIQVKMITGDSRPTALALGRKLHLLESGAGLDGQTFVSDDQQPAQIDDRAAFSGEQVQKLMESSMDELAKCQELASKSVFYRVDPIQKATIVGKLQELDKVVAMTGDGVNDVVSLKKANLSLVMGSGADVCKEIADVIMVENDLSVLTKAIIEGKGIYLKIRNFLSYQISMSLSLILLTGLSFAIRTEAPFSAIQLLFINLLCDGPPAQALGAEQTNKSELELKPRNVHEPLLGGSLLKSLVVLTGALVSIHAFLYFLLLDDMKLDAHARSLLFTSYVFSSIFAAISLRSNVKTVFEMSAFSNRELVGCAAITILVQVAILSWPPLSDLFNVTSLTYLELIYLLLYASSVLIVMDGCKILVRFYRYLRRRLTKDYDESSFHSVDTSKSSSSTSVLKDVIVTGDSAIGCSKTDQ